MEKIFAIIVFIGINVSAYASDAQLEKYILEFDYSTMEGMKIDSKRLIELLKEGKAQLIDIRFPEEYSAWKIGTSINIPINQLPNRLSEIDKNKITVTACPHKDRAIIAVVYLHSKGIKAKYLADGLTGLVENLRGEDAKKFIYLIEQLKP